MGEQKRIISDCRSFIDGIDELIVLRIMRDNPRGTNGEDRIIEEQIELLKRDLTDELRRHSKVQGVYVEAREGKFG